MSDVVGVGVPDDPIKIIKNKRRRCKKMNKKIENVATVEREREREREPYFNK